MEAEPHNAIFALRSHLGPGTPQTTEADDMRSIAVIIVILLLMDIGNGHPGRLLARPPRFSHVAFGRMASLHRFELSADAAEARDSHLSFLVYPFAFRSGPALRLPSVHLTENGGPRNTDQARPAAATPIASQAIHRPSEEAKNLEARVPFHRVRRAASNSRKTLNFKLLNRDPAQGYRQARY